jgi:hypothetical protein
MAMSDSERRGNRRRYERSFYVPRTTHTALSSGWLVMLNPQWSAHVGRRWGYE